MPTHRLAHYAILAAATAALTLPNLSAHSLWDMDEGVNVECTREMMEADTWVVPTFNWQLRTAKPIMTYWVQRASLEAFGVNEWAARLPSALLGIGTVLLTYELGRRMFGATTGLLGGIVLASGVQFCLLSHAATPDAPLIFFTVLALYLVWRGHENGGRAWFVLPAAACGLATLSKGPIGVGLPAIIVVSYLIWNRELWRAWDRRLVTGILVWALVAVPWYAYVTSETRGEYLGKFLGNENVNRFVTPMEGHRGPPVYYAVGLFVFFAPWCCFLGATLWYAVREARTRTTPKHPEPSAEARAHRFLLCWFLTYLVFFSAAATKLPNYIGPLYPALALLTARFLVRWREGTLRVPNWVPAVSVGGLAVVGLVCGLGMLLAGGELPVAVKGLRVFPGLAPWAAVGLIPLAAAAGMAWCLRHDRRGGVVLGAAVAAVAWVGAMAAGPPVVVDRYKAARDLVRESGAHQPERDVRLAAVAYFQESLVFYAERKVEKLFSPDAAADFLAMPRPGYLFVPEKEWAEHVRPRVTVPVRVVGRRYDFYKNADILVVTNEPDSAAE